MQPRLILPWVSCRIMLPPSLLLAQLNDHYSQSHQAQAPGVLSCHVDCFCVDGWCDSETREQRCGVFDAQQQNSGSITTHLFQGVTEEKNRIYYWYRNMQCQMDLTLKECFGVDLKKVKIGATYHK